MSVPRAAAGPRWRRALAISVAAAAAGYLLFSFWGGGHAVLVAVGRVGWGGVAVLLALSLTNYLLRFVRWQHYLKLLGHRLPWRPSLQVYIAGFALTTTPGKAGEALRSVLLQPSGVTYTHSIAALFSERFCDLLAVVLICLPGLWTYRPAQAVVGLCLALVAGVVLVLQREAWLRILQRSATRRLTPRLAEALAHVTEMAICAGRLFRSRTLALGLLLGVAAWGAEGLGFHYLLYRVGAQVPLAVSLFIYAFAMLVGALSFLPGGLGGAEVTMVVLLLLNGVGQAQAASATVVIRLATLWFAVVLGMLALVRPVAHD